MIKAFTSPVILAPHPDDEIIGCYTLLLSHRNNCTVIFTEPIGDRRKEMEISSAAFAFKWYCERHWEGHILANLTGGRCLVAPDPYFELHPAHKEIGAAAWALARRLGCPFFSYTTNMNVPYLRELKSEQAYKKRDLLDTCYPSQGSLWLQDHRYWLFEGMAQWDTTGWC